MFRFDVEKWVPKFLMADKNGYAIAKAIETGIQIMNDTIEKGVDCIDDYDTMPEWRLDELAWETNCLYDYNADIEAKRKWIRDALPLYRIFGTPQAIYKYISGYFDSVDLEENWIYGGKPYHFRVTVEGKWTPENEAWTRKAIGTAKNVRSVLDSLRIGNKCFLALMAEGEVLARFNYPMTATDNWAGRWPQDAFKGVLDESGKAALSAEISGSGFPYTLTGTRPQINTEGILDNTASVGVTSDASAYAYDYPDTAAETYSGTKPQENTLGIAEKISLGVTGKAEEKNFSYPITGTMPQENKIGIVDETIKAGMTGEVRAANFRYAMTRENLLSGTVPQESMMGVSEKEDIQAASADDLYAVITYKMCGEDGIQ